MLLDPFEQLNDILPINPAIVSASDTTAFTRDRTAVVHGLAKAGRDPARGDS
jgi:hypothetical protein